MDDDSANSVKSPLSSSDFESTSTANLFKKKKRIKRAVNKRRAISSDCSSSDSDEIVRRPPPLTRVLKNGKVGSIFDSSSESETGSNFQSGKTVKHSNPSDSSTRPSSSKIRDGASPPSCSKQAPEPTSASSSESPILIPRSKSKALVIDSDSSPDVLAGPSYKIRSIISESPTSSDSQNSSSIRETQSPNARMKDLESCKAMSTDDEGPIDYVRSTRKDNKLSSTESSGDDDDSPSCAICLSSLVNRIAAQISGCSHEFHNTCILKWSERTNTCPIDRLTFNRITVKNKQGKVVKVTEVEDKSAVTEEFGEMFLPDDCVICGNADNEDVLLLCDGCNRGFHIYCLNPPLDSVPEGNWICEHCSPVITLSDSFYLSDELDITIENFSDSNMTDPNGVESGLSDEPEQPSTSTGRTRTGNSRYRSDSTLSVSVSSRNQNVSRNTRVRQTTITIKQTRKRRKRRNRRRNRIESTVRSRNRIMAAMIAKRSSAVACSDGTNAETRQKMKTIKSEPGRPRLSLFSSDNFENYYNPNSGSDGEPDSSANGPVAVTARTRYPTSRVMDRKAAVARLINTNRRPRIAPRVTVPNISSSTSVNVLDDIMGMMDTESKKSSDKIPMKKDGTFVLPEKVDVNSDKAKTNVTETPRYPRGGGNPNRPRAQYGSASSGGYQNSGARHQSGVFSSRGMPPQFPPRFSNFGGARPNNDNFTFFRSPQPRFRPNVPRFPTRRSLPASLLIDPENEQEDPSQPDEDVDIYGDIDSTPLLPPSERTVPSTLEPPPQPPPGLFDLGPPPEPPADLLNLASPEEGPSDEDKGLIIDDNEYDPADPCDSPEPIENPPSISSDSTCEDLGAIPIPDGALPIHTCAPPPPGHVIEIDSDEECPNSSLYSSTSLAFARSKAKSLTDESNECEREQNGVQNKDVADEDDGTKKNGIAVKSAPIRFSIGTKNPVLSEPQRKIDLFNLADEDETEEEEEEETKIEEKNVEKEKEEDKDGSDKSSDEELEKTEELAQGEMKEDEEELAVSAIENGNEHLNGDKDIEDLLSSPPAEEEEGEEVEKADNIIDLNQNSSKDDSLDVSSIMSNKDNEKSLEEEIFGSDDKGDENELDKDEVSTQGDILDLNTENLHGVTDVTINDGSLPETDDKFDEEEAKNQSGGSFNCLDGLDVDPISDSEYGSLSDNADVDEDKNKTSEKRKKKKRKNTDREEGEIVEPKKKDRKKSKEENNENVMGEKKGKKKKDKDLAGPLSPLQEKTLSNNKDNFRRDTAESVAWKKLSKSTKDRNYRDKDESKNKKRKEARKEIERYNVRKVVGDKAFQRKDEFGRDISLSRSHSPSVTRSPRKRSLSREKSRSPGRKNKKRRSRSRSLERFANLKRSFSRSPVRPRKRSVSPGFAKLKDRKFQKNRGRSRSRSRRRSRTPKKTRSLSRSKQKRRSRSREKVRAKSKKEKNQEVVAAYKNAIKKKKKKQRSRSWSKSKRKSKSPRARSPWDFSSTSISRSPSPAPFTRKSRSWSRDNNLTVIVPNTKKKDKKKAKENKRRKHKDDHSPTLSKEVFTSGDNILVSVNFAHAEKNVTDSGTLEKVKAPAKKSKKDIQAMKAAKVREIAAKAKPVAIIDLDVSPFRERTPSPKEVIVLCDSDSENEDKSAKASELKASSGPKTPPEPHIKFSINSKNQAIGAIANPLLDIDDNKGPNTPPDPPSPLPTSPYDPFDPTKSRSPSPVSQSATNEGDLKIVSDSHEKNQLDLMKPVTPSKDSTSSPSKVISIDDNSVSNLNSISKLDDKLVTSSMSTTITSLPIYTPAMTTNSARNAMNGESMEDILNIDSDGVYSPASSLGDDLFDPPKKSPPPANKKFDSLFVPKNAPPKSIPYEPKHTKSNSLGAAGKKNSTLKYTPTKTTKSKTTSNISKLDEDQLKILDEVPSSAVEMQVKYKYLKKLNRQERVVEEVKIVLKPHYNKKHVTKEQYKEILRKAVPKICHNKSGEINPNKIHQLIEAYVKKYRVHNKRSKNPASGNAATNNANAAHSNLSNANNMGTAKKGKSMWT